MFIVYLMTWVVLLVVVAVSGSDKAAGELGPKASALAQLIIYGSIAVVVAAGWALNRFNRRVFPLASFLIGQERRRFETWEKVRWTVVVGLGVAVLGSLPATFLAW